MPEKKSNSKSTRAPFVLSYAIISRLFLLAIAIAADSFVPDYDTSWSVAQVADLADDTKGNAQCSEFDEFIFGTFGSVAKWDSIFFLRIAKHGYEFEQYHAFFPLLPIFIRALKSFVLDPVTNALGLISVCDIALYSLSAFIISNISFIIAAMLLYYAGVMILKNEKVAYMASLLFCLSPANIFLSAAGYTESLYAMFTFAGILALHKSSSANYYVSGAGGARHKHRAFDLDIDQLNVPENEAGSDSGSGSGSGSGWFSTSNADSDLGSSLGSMSAHSSVSVSNSSFGHFNASSGSGKPITRRHSVSIKQLRRIGDADADMDSSVSELRTYSPFSTPYSSRPPSPSPSLAFDSENLPTSDLLLSAWGWVAAICFALSGATRSTGFLHAGFIGHIAVREFIQKYWLRSSKPSNASEFLFGGLQLMNRALQFLIVFVPYIAFQYYGYTLYCPGRPWCDSKHMYPFIQSEYWGVGFLKYYELKQIPNFLLAAPAIALSVFGVVRYLRSCDHSVMYSLGFVWSNSKLKLRNNLLHARGFASPLLFPHVVLWAAIVLLGLTNMHVQVLTRTLSPVAVFYWFAAHLWHTWKSKGCIFVYFVGYSLIGVVLFSNFYPWT